MPNRVTKGDSLNSLVLQPGWTVENDGYGLLTCTATYIVSHGNDAGTQGGGVSYAVGMAPKRGDLFPKDTRLKCHRSSSSLNSNGIMVITAEYIGIASGNMTTPQSSARGSITTEPIATHPAFVPKIGGKKDSPKFGAEFEDDGAFKRFATADNRKYGVKSYYSPTFSFSGFFYTSDIKVAKKLADVTCCSSSDGQWKNIQLLDGLNGLGGDGKITSGAWSAPDESPQLLLTGIGVEYYGTVIKVTFDILGSLDGYDTDIYPYATGGRPKRSYDTT